MTKWNRKPEIETLRAMAERATDPVVAQALRDLADEYERLKRENSGTVA